MDADIVFVKEQIAVQARLASRYALQPHRAGLHHNTVECLKRVLTRLEGESSRPDTSVGLSKKVNVSLTDLDDAPPELLAELSISETDLQEMILEDIIIKNAGVISLDKLIVKFYSRQKEILKRSTLTSRLYRMAEKGMIFNVPSKRGYYSAYEMTEDDVCKVFGRPEKPVENEDALQQPVSSSDSDESDQNSSLIVRRRRRSRRSALELHA